MTPYRSVAESAKNRFRELESYEFDWRSFYNGYIEAAIPGLLQQHHMLTLIEDMLSTFRPDSTTPVTAERVEAWHAKYAEFQANTQAHDTAERKD